MTPAPALPQNSMKARVAATNIVSARRAAVMSVVHVRLAAAVARRPTEFFVRVSVVRSCSAAWTMPGASRFRRGILLTYNSLMRFAFARSPTVAYVPSSSFCFQC